MKKLLMATETKDHPIEENEYFELRIPKISKNGVPVIVTLMFMALSFLAGLLTMRYLSDYQGSTTVTDATGAFVSYAKQLRLNTNEFTSCLESGKFAESVTTDMNNGSSLDVSATPSFFINGRMVVGAQPYSTFKEMIDQELSGNRSPLTPEEASGSAQVDVAKGHLPVIGSNKAKITIVEFSDFQCPFCERFFLDTYPQLKKEYLDTGKAQLTFRHYPLTSIHPNAQKAHEASECANEQGKFWEYHDKLFQNQSVWSDLPLVTTTST
jgi:protein-disulfide isomerase